MCIWSHSETLHNLVIHISSSQTLYVNGHCKLLETSNLSTKLPAIEYAIWIWKDGIILLQLLSDQWTVSLLQKLQFSTLKENKMAKIMRGLRKLHNEELYNLYSIPYIIRMIESKRVKWALVGEKCIQSFGRKTWRKKATWKTCA